MEKISSLEPLPSTFLPFFYPAVAPTIFPELKPNQVARVKRTSPSSLTPEHVRELGSEMITILDLAGSPVGVRLLVDESSRPMDAHELKHHRYCQAVMKARRGEHVTLDKEGLSCSAAAAAFGFKPLPAQLKSGKGLVEFGIVADPEVGKKIFDNIPHLDPGGLRLLDVFPLEKAESVPDIVVVEDAVETLMWLTLAYLQATGGERVSGTTAILASRLRGLYDYPLHPAATEFRLWLSRVPRGDGHRAKRNSRRFSCLVS